MLKNILDKFFNDVTLLVIIINKKMKKTISRRNTPQRNIILQSLRCTKMHPNAEEIFRTVRKQLPTISFGTVYRNLNLLKESGQILELACGKCSSRYDGEVRNHYHFFCLSCEKVFDLEWPLSAHLDRQVSRKTGYQVNFHRINFYGQCQKCKKIKKRRVA